MLVRTLLFKIATIFDAKGFDEADEAAEKVKKSAAATEVEVKKLDKALEGEADAAKKSAKATDKAADEIKDLDKQAEGAGKQVGILEKVMGQAATGIATAFASAGLDALLAGLANAISFIGEETARLDEIAKRAQKTGFSVGDIQKFTQVATLSGSEVAVLTKGITNLEIQLDVIGRGGAGPAAEAIETLGLSFEELQDADPTEQLKLISEALLRIDDPAERSLQAFKLLGEEGRELIPLFNSGADAIDDMVASTGKVFTRADLAKAEAYQDVLAGLDKTIADVKGTAALALVPAFERVTGLADEAIPVIIEWAQSFGDRLIPSFERLLAAVQPWLDRAGPGLIDTITKLLIPLETAADVVSFFADQISFLIEVGNSLLEWIEELLGQVETRWPRVFSIAGAVIDGILNPLDTARSTIGKIVDFLERAFDRVEGLSEQVAKIKSAVGLGEGEAGGLVQIARAARGETATPAPALADRRAARRQDRSAARAAQRGETARVEASILRRRAGRRPRGGGGGGGGGAAPPPAPEPGLLDQLGLTAPEAVLAGREQLPQTLTLIFSTTIKLIESLVINIEGSSGPEQTRQLEDAATQARDALVAKLSDIPKILAEISATNAKALRARAAGGRTAPGVT